MTETLNAKQVFDVGYDSVHKDEEVPDPEHPPETAIIIHGITTDIAFHRERLEANRAKVIAMLRQLPRQFMVGRGGGGGWSFLNAHLLDDGGFWTGEQRMAELLLLLGMGLGLVKLVPDQREVWKEMAGGVPYVCITLPKEKVQ